MEKTAYLTIDDAPSVDMISKVDYLASKKIRAVWFCSGERCAQHPESALYALKNGHIIANHGYDHPRFSTISLEECFDQILRTDTIITQLYKEAAIPWTKKYFRFPYGDKGGLRTDSFGCYTKKGAQRKETLQKFLRDNGYTQPSFEKVTYYYFDRLGLRDDADWSWTYDCAEWSISVPERMDGIDSIEKVLARMDRYEPNTGFGLNSPSSAEIILTHDHLETTVYFPQMIDGLRAKGLQFTLPE
jgi:peptidoglycan/xylan/chitin deacetylase (PgdA/CDA1 family)